MGRRAFEITNVVAQCLDKLRALPFVQDAKLAASERAELDATLRIETPNRRFVLPCEIKRGPLSADSAQALIHLARRNEGLIVLASTIGNRIGDTLEGAHVNFVDAAGNCNVNLGKSYVARVEGRKAGRPPPTDRGLRAPAYRALFSLIATRDLANAPSRAIAADARVSPQTANDLRQWLIEQGMLLTAGGRRHWAPRGLKQATSLWLAGFSTTLGPSLVIGRFRARERDPLELESRIEKVLDASCPWRYGGSAASSRLVGHYRGDRTVIYTQDAPTDLWKELHFVRDSIGTVVLMDAPAVAAFGSPVARCVHPLLAYADLLAERNDRAQEAAGLLHEKFLSDFGVE